MFVAQSFVISDLIFPVFMLVFYPPLLGIAIALNLIIDAFVQFIAFLIMHIKIAPKDWFGLLFPLWIQGLIADFAGSFLLAAIMLSGALTPKSGFDPYSIYNSALTVTLFILAVIVSALLIYFMDVRLLKKKLPTSQAVRIALVFAIFTAPYTFLIPTTLLIH